MTVEAMPARAGRHRWGDPVTIERDDTKSQCQETHRRCLHCPLVKVTVHPPSPDLAYRLWQYPDGHRDEGLTPMCTGEIIQGEGA